MRPSLLPGGQDIRNTLIKTLASWTTTFVPTAVTQHLSFLRGSLVQAQGQIEDGTAANKSFLVVILDFHVEDVDRAIELAALVVQIVEHSIEATLLAGNHDIDNAGFGTLGALVFGMVQSRLSGYPVLESLGVALDGEVAAEHIKQAVCRVQLGILCRQFRVDGAVGGAVEVVDVGLLYSRAGKPHQGASAKGDGREMGESELQMGFHGPRSISMHQQGHGDVAETHRF